MYCEGATVLGVWEEEEEEGEGAEPAELATTEAGAEETEPKLAATRRARSMGVSRAEAECG